MLITNKATTCQPYKDICAYSSLLLNVKCGFLISERPN
jgi:hypothetical protein